MVIEEMFTIFEFFIDEMSFSLMGIISGWDSLNWLDYEGFKIALILSNTS